MSITDIQSAKYFKKRNLPLNTPVVDHQLSAIYEKHWLNLNKAYAAFMDAAAAYATADERPTTGEFKKLKKRLNHLEKTMQRCDVAIIRKLKDKGEQALMGYFLAERAVPFVYFWRQAIAAVESGEDFGFNSNDIPPWFDK
jgi:hypothetical protein